MNVDWQKLKTNKQYQKLMLFQYPELCDRVDILEDAYLRLFYGDITLLGRIRNQHIDMCNHAVAVNVKALKYIKIDLPDEFYIRIMKNQTDAFKWINNPSHKICKYAVSFDGMNIKYIPQDKQTYELQLRAVKTTAEAIVFCYVPNRKIVWLAISRNPKLIASIIGRSQSMVLSAIQDDINLDPKSQLINQIPKKFTRAHGYVKLLRA